MTDNWDAFGDVLEGQTGIFEQSDGLRSYDSIKHVCTAEGLVIEMPCRGCNRPKQITVTWPEIIAIYHNISPSEVYSRVSGWQQFASPWRQTNTRQGVHYAWYPDNIICQSCQTPITPHVQPAECARHIGEMDRNGWMSQQQKMEIGQVCQQVAQALGRRR